MTRDWIAAALPLFREACELPAAERASFLDGACGGDTELRRHVDAMLAWDDTEDTAKQDTHPVRAALEHLVERTESAPALPESIGGHRIVRLIAHGGMGVVYEAQQEHPRRRVAIKVARTGGALDERAQRFQLEAQLLAKLRHPGIAQIIEAGTTSADDGARPFFVMELVEGQPLTAYAREHLTTVREKLELMVRVCEAVAFAHGRGVVHRDLKPDNVLVERDGRPKVLDFGVAKVEAAGGFDAATLRTEAGRVLGTLGYMAPEQLGGVTEGLGPEADVYSLGVMIYELLSGRLPHDLDGVTLTRALAVVANTDAPLLGVIRPELRGDIEAVAAKALEKDARYRYADAGALQADLERYLRGEPTLARPAGPLRKTAKWARRNPALAASVLGLFLALTAVATVLLVKNEEVSAALAEFELLADAKRLERAETRAAELFPTRPDVADGIDEWCREFGRLADQLPHYESTLEKLRARGHAGPGESWSFDDDVLQLKHDVLAQLVADVGSFQAGLAKRMEARLALARTIETETVDARRADWDAARERIRANEKYHGLTLEPQVGLIPLGPDPVSTLEEFLHFETHAGEIPRRHDIGDLPRVTGDTGLVLVLIPGGTFWMGSQEDETAPDYDPGSVGGRPGQGAWEERYEATVEPFFLSKFEMTQGQWLRCEGTNPSKPPRPGVPINLAKPVSQVSWPQCNETVRRLGLILPHEVQWEYAARAGSTTAWWTGDEERQLAGAENISEGATALVVADWWWKKSGVQPAPWFDIWKYPRLLIQGGGPAPVGFYKANGFGLFDVAGNVSEWCSNIPGYHHKPKNPPLVPPRMVRGGNFQYGVQWARSAWRYDAPQDAATGQLGLRPAMTIQR